MRQIYPFCDCIPDSEPRMMWKARASGSKLWKYWWVECPNCGKRTEEYPTPWAAEAEWMKKRKEEIENGKSDL